MFGIKYLMEICHMFQNYALIIVWLAEKLKKTLVYNTSAFIAISFDCFRDSV